MDSTTATATVGGCTTAHRQAVQLVPWGAYGQFACFFETGEVMSLLMGGNQTRMEAPCHLLNQIKEVTYITTFITFALT